MVANAKYNKRKIMDDKKGKEQALKAITSLRQLVGLEVISSEEYTSIRNKVMAKYGKYLSPIRATLD